MARPIWVRSARRHKPGKLKQLPGSVVFHLIVSFALIASGCTSDTVSTLQTDDVLAMNAEARNRPYVLGLGDVVTVKFLYNDELNDEVTIRPDGKVSLSLLGDITAAGLSPVEFEPPFKKNEASALA